IAGDSAGGGLTMATLLALKANAHPLPACAIGISPWLDLTGSGESAVPGVVDDPMLTLEGLRDSARQYAADNTADPLASPIYGD
ncbi:MAG: alpha/beta hydrolase fold domain-containing protein, partial [Pseudomonadales bacterium]|nr:alpha/beta hydrolase fold domain-containing protein [Pseudomonadales bacterium]